MTDHTPNSKVSRLEVVSTGARRSWTLEEKQRIVAESYGGPRLVSVTARRNGLSASQLFTWRRLARENRLRTVGPPFDVPKLFRWGHPRPTRASRAWYGAPRVWPYRRPPSTHPPPQRDHGHEWFDDRMRLVRSPYLASSLNGSCTNVCPVKIKIQSGPISQNQSEAVLA
jgi:hypothetical protein